MQNHRRLYLFTLEVAPMAVGETHNPLPSHLTLISRFHSELPPEELASATKPVFDKTPAVALIFGQPERFGHNKPVSLVDSTPELISLHTELSHTLDKLSVEYTAPQWIGAGWRPHVTERPGVQFEPGQTHLSKAAYLIEVIIHGDAHIRIIHAKFPL